MQNINAKKLIGVLCAFLLAVPAYGEQREIGWEDLVPEQEFDDPFTALTPDQLYDLGTVFRTRQYMAADSENVTEDMIERSETLEQELDAQGIDVDALIAMRDEVAEQRRLMSMAVVDQLNGQNIRMPGYVLPLEFDGDKVTEFFLVPWVGACMHAPTPPPNQMVHVTSVEGIETSGLYDPVWVNGEMSTEGKTNEFMFNDGGLNISAGYSMVASEVEPYE